MQINKTYLVIEFKDNDLTAIEFTYNWKKLVLKNYSFLELEEGVIERGKILKPEILNTSIQNLLGLAMPKTIKCKNLIAIISDDVNFHHVLTVSKQLNDKELLSVIPAKAENFVPYPKDQLFWDYRLGQSLNDQDIPVQYSAVPKEIINSYLNIFNDLKLNTQVITGIAESYVEVIRDFDRDLEKVLVMEINYNSTNLLLFKNGLLHATKSLPQGVAKCLSVLATHNQLSEADLLEQLISDNLSSLVKSKDLDCFQSFFNEIKNNISSLIDHKNLDRIFVWGLGLRIPNMLEHLQQNLTPSPEIDLMWKAISISKSIRQTEILDNINHNVLSFGVAVSGAYNFINPYGNKILNFLPEQNKRSVGNNVMNSFISRIAVFILAISLGTIFILSFAILDFRFEESKLTQQTQIFESSIYGERYYELKENISLFNQEVNYLYGLSTGLQTLPQELTDALILKTDNIHIHNLSFLKESQTIEIRGLATDRESLVSYKTKLEKALPNGKVDAPLSNFDSNQDIEFDFKVILNPDTNE